ncbi:MAG: HEPN domain-containing protein [Candidatus Wallbacteria bacterium]|nr:HEPN domain-containing protein [Candidatus Wallbacteria bacterium]
MPPIEHIQLVVREWISKAENDFTAARHLLSLGDEAPFDVICFHAQQCVEKYLKAVMVAHSLPVPKTHDIEKIAGILAPVFPIDLTPEQMRLLAEYAADVRYPGVDFLFREDAEEALRIADEVRKAIRATLLF